MRYLLVRLFVDMDWGLIAPRGDLRPGRALGFVERLGVCGDCRRIVFVPGPRGLEARKSS
jgi:hypothetical protein